MSAEVTIVLTVAVPLLAAVSGLVVRLPASARFSTWAAVVVAAVALLVAGSGVVAPVFFVMVALNHLLGLSESVPFSDYRMFSRPEGDPLYLRFERADGTEVATSDHFTVMPGMILKRFRSERRSGLEQGLRPGRELETHAGRSLGEYLDRHRSVPLGAESEEVSIVRVQCLFEDGRFAERAEPIGTVRV